MTDEHKTTIMHAPIAAPATRMHPLVNAAMQSGALADPATLRELLAVQREWEAGEARKAYARALSSLKRDLPTVIAKDSTVDYQSAKGRTFYRHASLAGVMDAITDPLTSHGFSLSWVPSSGERGGVRVTCRLTHAEGHIEECALEAPPDTSGAKSSAQAIASTITLLSRYTALALLGIATADMPEDTGEAAKVVAHDEIDADRNLRAAKWLADQGVSREAVERHIGRPVSGWTTADLDEVRAYGLRVSPKKSAEAPKADAKQRTREEKIAAGEDPDA